MFVFNLVQFIHGVLFIGPLIALGWIAATPLVRSMSGKDKDGRIDDGNR